MTDSSLSPPSETPRRRRRRWWLLGVPLALLVFHVPLLRSCSTLVIVEEPQPEHFDAVVMEGGDDRHDLAAGWVKSGVANRILLTRRAADRNVVAGIVPPDDFLDRKKLLELGVNDEQIACLDNERTGGEWRELRL